MDDLQRAIEYLTKEMEYEGHALSPLLEGKETIRMQMFKTAVYALRELRQYRERIEQLKHAEVRRFECRLPDGRICHFSDFMEFLEKGEVK